MKSDNKKFFTHAAERLERRLIEDEFFRHYDYRIIYGIFVLVFLSNVFINVDHGTLPGCSNEIMADLGMAPWEFGILGSIVYGGLTLGSAVSTGVFSQSKWVKPALVLTLFFNGITLWVFTLSKSFYIDAGLRFLIGFF